MDWDISSSTLSPPSTYQCVGKGFFAGVVEIVLKWRLCSPPRNGPTLETALLQRALSSDSLTGAEKRERIEPPENNHALSMVAKRYEYSLGPSAYYAGLIRTR